MTSTIQLFFSLGIAASVSFMAAAEKPVGGESFARRDRGDRSGEGPPVHPAGQRVL